MTVGFVVLASVCLSHVGLALDHIHDFRYVKGECANVRFKKGLAAFFLLKHLVVFLTLYYIGVKSSQGRAYMLGEALLCFYQSCALTAWSKKSRLFYVVGRLLLWSQSVSSAYVVATTVS